MELFVVVIALAFVQIWGARNPLHHDAWFERWVKFVSKGRSTNFQGSWLGLFCFIGIPAVLLWWFIVFLVGHSVWILLPISVVILLYSFGRGEFRDIVRAYTQACYVEDWAVALERARVFGLDTQKLGEKDWSSLNQRVFEQAAYRGFERMFGVLFWFFILGPVAAFAYRLLVLFVERAELSDGAELYQAVAAEDMPKAQTANEHAAHEQKAQPNLEMTTQESTHSNGQVESGADIVGIDGDKSDDPLNVPGESRAHVFLRYAEWPGARLLALTFSLTGNFSTTIEAWGKDFIRVNSSTSAVLNDACLGALSLSDELKADCNVTRKELNLLTKLYTRTLWLWLGLAAFFFLYA